jgi:peptidyl-tRNA hydrolase, PTH1 family
MFKNSLYKWQIKFYNTHLFSPQFLQIGAFMTDSIKLIVGLGNPGAQYERTRHNAGFEFVDELARQHQGSFKKDSKYFGDVCSVIIGTQKVWLLKPTTFMNRSGQGVQALANFYKIPVEEILVAHDELDIDPGCVKLKQGGGHGGHNGLRDIIAKMANNKNFKRVRLGIGHPGDAKQVADFVLGKAPKKEYELTTACIDEVCRYTDLAVKGDWQKAMNAVNGYKA